MFSEPKLKTEAAFGFRSVFVTIEVSDVEATAFNPEAVALLNDMIGAPGSVMAEANFEKSTGSLGTGKSCSVQWS